jgi:predicted transcriptional regulator
MKRETGEGGDVSQYCHGTRGTTLKDKVTVSHFAQLKFTSAQRNVRDLLALATSDKSNKEEELSTVAELLKEANVKKLVTWNRWMNRSNGRRM